MKKHRALILLDGSEFSRQILPVVHKLLSPQEYELIFMHVADDEVEVELFTPLYEIGEQKMMMPLDQDPRCIEIIRQHQEILAESAQPFQEAGYQVLTVVKLANPFKDPPVSEILEFVDVEKIDLVAMTTHGRTGMQRLLFGSVAEEVVRGMSAPVLLLRPVPLA